MNELRVFSNGEFGDVRTDVDEDGKVLFCASDVAKALGYSVPRKAVFDHCRCVLKRNVPHPQSPDKTIEMSFVPESDVYRLTFSSKLPNAERFTDWVTEDVLPSIRKRGGYIAGQESLSDTELLARAVLLAQKTIEDKTRQLAKANETIGIMSPKAAYYDNVLQSENLLTVSQIAKCYGQSATWLNKMLHGMGVQYKQGGQQWLLYQKYADKDYTRIVTIMDGTGQARQQTKWTQSGKKFIYDLLKKMGVMPMSERGKDDG